VRSRHPSRRTDDYNYNESVTHIGADPSTLAVAHQGPVYPTDGTGLGRGIADRRSAAVGPGEAEAVELLELPAE